MEDVDENDFLKECERMMSKHRLTVGDEDYNKKKKDSNKIVTICQDQILNKQGIVRTKC